MNHRPRSHSRSIVLGAALLASCTPREREIPVSTAADEGDASSSTTGPPASDGSTVAALGTSSSSTDDGCMPVDEPEWWDPAWHHRRRLRIEAAAFPGPLSDFPLLLRVPMDDLGPTGSERGGADLRFRSSDQDVSIAHELDAAADGELAIWLLLPELDPSEGPTTIWMYYDNPAAEESAAPEDVWAGFISVHHLGADLRDSAGEHHGASPWEPELCEGDCGPRIGLARRFEPTRLHEVVLDGHQDYDLGSDPYAATLSFSVSLWMRSASFAAYPWGPMVAKGESTWRVHTVDYVDPLLDERVSFAFDCALASCVGLVDPWGNYNLVASSTEVDDVVDDGAWHQVVATLAVVDRPEEPPPDYVPNLRARIYVDGAEVAVSPLLPAFLLPEDDEPVRFGHNINTSNRWRGDLDEVRIATGVRSATQIAADYATVVDDELVHVGEEQAWCP